MAQSACLFCKIVAGDIACAKVYEDEVALAFRDIQPQAPTHLLLIPKAHITSLNDYSQTLSSDALNNMTATFGHLLSTVPKIAAEAGLADNGYRTVINTGADGGQTVFHLHIHILGSRPLTWPPG